MHTKNECGFGHDHEGHVHGEDCGCGHVHVLIEPVEDLSVLQQNFLLALYERRYLPLARFAMGNTGDEEIYSVALEPVYIGTPQDTLEQVKALGEQLDALMRSGLVTLDYDMLLGSYGYAEYETADIYRYFKETVAQGSGQPGALFNEAYLEKGSMALTERGMERVEKMLGQ